MIAEKSIRIASRLYEARDAARLLYGDHFHTKIATAQDSIREVMGFHKCEALPAAMSLVTELQKSGGDSARTQCLIMAAYVEMAEPSAQPTAA